MADLQRKIRQYQRLKRLIPQLENQIRDEGFALMSKEGVLQKPRIERVIQQYG